MSREEYNKKYPDPIDKNEDELYDKFINEMCGKMYVYNLRDFSKKELGMDARDICSDLIPNTNKYVYLSENKISISDLNTKSEIGSIDASIFEEDNNSLQIGAECMGRWSKDGKCFISYDYEDLIVYNIEKDSVKKIKVNKDNRHISLTPSYYSENGEDIYYVGVKYNKNANIQGIYKVNTNDENEKIEEVFNLPENDENESSLTTDDYTEENYNRFANKNEINIITFK